MFQHDSPLMEALSIAADYVILNLLCLLLCLPVVTIGASMTAEMDVAMRIARGEEPSVFSAFFTSFRKNFVQAEVTWLILALAIGLIGADWILILRQGISSWPFVYLLLLGLASYLALGTFFSVFPMIARFQMKTKDALKGAVVFSLIRLPRTLLGILLMALPYVLSYYYMEWALGLWLLCTGVALYYNSQLFVKAFRPVEEKALSRKEAGDADTP